MNNLSSYCGLTGARLWASERYLPVPKVSQNACSVFVTATRCGDRKSNSRLGKVYLTILAEYDDFDEYFFGRSPNNPKNKAFLWHHRSLMFLEEPFTYLGVLPKKVLFILKLDGGISNSSH